MKLCCPRCREQLPFDPTLWRCPCGGVLEIGDGPSFDPAQVAEGDYTLWRYRDALPLPRGSRPLTLGEGWTALVDAEWADQPVRFKLEHLNPTGSFKDRGAALLVTALKAVQTHEVVDDSSGNAGAALAAYAARGGLAARIFVPHHSSPAKRAQIVVYGAEVVTVSGSRTDTSRAVLEALDEGVVYASHAYNPLYVHGMKTIAFEIWEQCGRAAPSSIVVPVGHGGLLLGLYVGFDELLSAGLVRRVPAFFGVQAEACAPLARACERGSDEAVPVDELETIAGGVRVTAPSLGSKVLAAVRHSEGAIVAVADQQTLLAQRRLARRGFYVEPTSAVAVAALDDLRAALGESAVVVLTGSGLKSPPKSELQ